MRWVVLITGLLLAGTIAAQEAGKKKKPEARKQKQQQVAHKKPTPEQIRKFKDLEKKQKKG